MNAPSQVELRPFTADELGLMVEGRARAVAEGTPPVGPSALDRSKLAERIAAGGRYLDGRLDLALVRAGRVIGEVDARSPEGAFPPGVFEIGVAIYNPEDRGRGAGREAVALLTTLLFDRYDAHRVQASTDVSNAAMRRVLTAVGYSFEGILREFMPAGDRRADFALYAVTLTEWPEQRA